MAWADSLRPMRDTSEPLFRGPLSSLLLDSEIQVRLLLTRSKLLDPSGPACLTQHSQYFCLERLNERPHQRRTCQLHKLSQQTQHSIHELVRFLLPLCFVVDEE